jgi:pimeloyl-ACP methyl ester carboxylesterase
MPEIELKPCFLTPRKLQPDYPLFVYLPGLDGTGKLLRWQTAGLEAGFDVRCLVIPRQDLTSWDTLSKNVIDLIHAELEKSSQRAIYLCGESFGGCLAMKVAVKSPQLFKRIILINPASALKLQMFLHWTSKLIFCVPSSLYDIGTLGLLPFIAALERIPKDVRHELLKTMRFVPPETLNWRLFLLREFDVTKEELQTLTQPVLLIAGGSDRLLPSDLEVQRLESILPDGQIVMLPHSGHACLLESDVNLYKILQKQRFIETNITKNTALEAKTIV